MALKCFVNLVKPPCTVCENFFWLILSTVKINLLKNLLVNVTIKFSENVLVAQWRVHFLVILQVSTDSTLPMIVSTTTHSATEWSICGINIDL